MKEHLPPQRITEIVVAGAGPLDTAHLAGCTGCRAEVARLQEALAEFRRTLSAHAALTSMTVAASQGIPARRAGEARWGRWPLYAAAAIVLASAAPIYQTVRAHHMAAQAAADAQLMEQVDREISEAVPNAMQSLQQLVVWDTAQEDNSQKGDIR